MTYPRNKREGAAAMTIPLQDLALSDRESVFHTPRAGDVALLAVLVVVLLANGAWIWSRLGFDNQAGRAIFFGLMLLCAYWGALVYTFKLSLTVRVSPRGLGVARGPWQVELRWSEIARLMERVQTIDRQRFRWVIVLASDGRRIQVREDAILEYGRFRREVYERYRLYRDHGGTWGATGGGPFSATEVVADEARWWVICALALAAPGVYFTMLLPELNPLGPALLGLVALALLMMVRVYLRRQTYTVDPGYIEARSFLHRSRLTWGEVARIERVRHAISGILLTGVALGRLLLRITSRGDQGIRSFAWSPRVPEYLILRGGGRHVRVRLRRLAHPDELLAWIEFYDQTRSAASAARAQSGTRPSGHPSAPSRPVATSGPLTTPRSTSAPDMAPPDLSGSSGPLDPWGAGRAGDPSRPARSRPTAPDLTADSAPTARYASAASRQELYEPYQPTDTHKAIVSDNAADDAWLRETTALFSMSSARAEQDHTSMPEPTLPDEWAPEQANAELPGDGHDGEDLASAPDAAPPPWRDSAWQPPILPRFGPNAAPSDDPRDRR